MVRRKTPAAALAHAQVPPRTILAAVARELDQVQSASRGGWTPELVGRALAALRIAGTYAIDRAAGQRLVSGDVAVLEGELPVSAGFGRGRFLVSGCVTTQTASIETAPHGLADALQTLTVARYGRTETLNSTADDAVATAIRVTKAQQSAHSLLSEGIANFKKSVVDLRKRVWA